MKRNHRTHCLVGIGAAVALFLAFGVQAGALVYLAVALACPLMMVLVMRGMTGTAGHEGCNHPEHHDATVTPRRGQASTADDGGLVAVRSS